jgi:hypothetical protein
VEVETLRRNPETREGQLTSLPEPARPPDDEPGVQNLELEHNQDDGQLPAAANNSKNNDPEPGS